MRSTCWTGAELGESGAHLITLEDAEVAELAEELAVADPGEEFSIEVGTRPRLEALAGHVLERVEVGPGFALVGGSALADLPDQNLRALIAGISTCLGSPMAQNPRGERIVSVRDEQPRDASAVRGYRTNARLLMHTDAADVAGLLCLASGAGGGATVFASAERVHDTLVEECPELLHELYRPWHWDRRGLEPPGEPPTLQSPIFSYYGGWLRCRYAPALLRAGAERAGGALTEAQAEALDRFDEIAQRESLQIAHVLRRGESVWMGNYTVLHGRHAFQDGGDERSTRHLLRTWVWCRSAPTLAPFFASPREVYRAGGHSRGNTSGSE